MKFNKIYPCLLFLAVASSTAFAGHWNQSYTKAGAQPRSDKRDRENAQPEINLAEIELFYQSSTGEKENTSVLELIQSNDPERLEFAKEVLIEYLSSIPASYWSNRYVHHILSNGAEVYFSPFVEKFVQKYAGYPDQAKIIKNFSQQISRIHN